MKRSLAILLIVGLLLSIPVHATVKGMTYRPQLSFDGNTANCSIIISANADDEITATLKLWRGNTCLATWTETGTGHLRIVETKSVTVGYAYMLTADVTLNGSTQPRTITSAMCK